MTPVAAVVFTIRINNVFDYQTFWVWTTWVWVWVACHLRGPMCLQRGGVAVALVSIAGSAAGFAVEAFEASSCDDD